MVLINTKGNHVIVPIAINYEALPEQSGLANEADGNSRSHLSIVRLFSWFKVSRHCPFVLLLNSTINDYCFRLFNLVESIWVEFMCQLRHPY